ncbi:PIN domain-containing protein [Streptomyces sp. 8K308]|uniref:type II toxin-antitoxin system VapC family toxin n=1 Tax=Streptomyces sp. 8K308 TaxID=2530388 RepID=UPI001052EAFA|nr:type II toxin-antitoxin system VapC family toxin [Streptomyces sp. 8K308]TDC23382.1 PIN domain-containing protein [Streptomyces sp. 8K308]
MIVVDSSTVVLALTHGGNLGREASKRLTGQRLLAPSVIDFEVAHAMRGLVQGGKITAEKGQTALALAASLLIRRTPGYVLFDRVWDLRQDLSAYDAAYVALAEHARCTLVTADARIERAGVARCPIDTIG